MRRLIPFLIPMLLALGCSEEVKKETGEAIDATKDYLADQKQEFLSEIQDGLDGAGDRLDEWKKRLDETGEKVKVKSEEVLSKLERTRERLAREVEEAGDATGKTWDETRSEITRKWREFQETLAEAAAAFES